MSGPRSLADDRLQYNQLIKSTAEQQMLLNLVRLRYSETPSSLAISNIATQTEVVRSLGLVPFFGVVGDQSGLSSIGRVLPQAQVTVADRPTVTLTPLDDSEFTRKLFTPMTLEGVLYLAKTTWPIATVFRLWLENLNWVPNAESASGPAQRGAPEYARFLAGIDALQALQDQGQVVFGVEERDEPVGSPIGAAQVTGRDLVNAAKEGFEYRRDEGGATWTLMRKKLQPMLRINPAALDSPEMRAFAAAFRLRRGQASFDIGVEKLAPFPSTYAPEGVTQLDLETRSLLQVMYSLSKAVDVPAAHRDGQWLLTTVDGNGLPFDWQLVNRGLFRVESSVTAPPATALVSVRYLDHWFYIDRRDAATMSTFSLLLELARLETTGKLSPGPMLTLPLSGR